ncbi:hypothetical protein [Halovivax limisalsi]|uniref:hypothetical protein n=1 Tax=Halovivax limisalsi TaxID=1453760 RepID=UPI001FFDEC0A|nr:hypothetical protein [Halovivax limisalsi]
MAPRVRFYSLGKMEPEEFEVYREFQKMIDVTRFDEDEGCWYIPLADAIGLVDEAKRKTVPDSALIKI